MNNTPLPPYFSLILCTLMLSGLATPTFSQSNGWGAKSKPKQRIENTRMKLKSLERMFSEDAEKQVIITLMDDKSLRGNFEYLERALDNLQSYRKKIRGLKRNIRHKKRSLERKEKRLMAKIQDIEQYVLVDERLSKTTVADYYKEIALLSSRLMLNRTDQRRLKNMERRVKRLLRKDYSSNHYNRGNHCGNYSYYYQRGQHHSAPINNPWGLAFFTLFGVNVLIGGVIAYKTLRK